MSWWSGVRAFFFFFFGEISPLGDPKKKVGARMRILTKDFEKKSYSVAMFLRKN
jgi:hypothetical protein